MVISIQIGVGELMDRYTILKIKLDEIKDEEKSKNVKREYEYISEIISKLEEKEGIQELVDDLFETNGELWDVEDELRYLEKLRQFDDNFINLARMVYKLNDERAAIKKLINVLYGSEFVEEKSYK